MRNYMAFQDDSREIEIRNLFQLLEPPNRKRDDVDAILRVNSKVIEFELKSTTENRSVTTARDVGFTHLEKWKTKHWIIGIYNKQKFSHAIYLNPSDMSEWIKEKEEYIRADFDLANALDNKISMNDMYKILGKKKTYSYEDAKKLQKLQQSKEEYMSLMDLKNGYSAVRMLELVHSRVKYLVLRGSTLNNPHIPTRVINKGQKITKDYALTLRKILKAS